MRSQIRSVVVASTKCNSFSSSPSSCVVLSSRFFDAQSSTTQAQAHVLSQVSYSSTTAANNDDVMTSTTTNNNPGTDTTCTRRGGITRLSSSSSSSSNYNYGDIVHFTGKGISTSNNISRATPREVELILFHMQNSDF